MKPIRSISVLMPTFQGAGLLERVLEALAGQECALPWDVLAIDSGSSDGTLEALERAAEGFPVPLRVESIHPVEFDHGDTRNLLASRSEGDLLVFLTQDAIPGSRDWLSRLAANFEDRRVGAAYCRNAPRPDAELLTVLFSEKDPGYQEGRREVRIEDAAAYEAMSPLERRLLYNFNDVASAVRRELWERHPFPRTEFGEDLLMARALLEGGYAVVYDDAAVVEHSHDYTEEELLSRGRIDGRFNAEHLGRICVESESDAEELARRQLERDREGLAAAGLSGEELEAELARAAGLRRAIFRGLWEGGRSGLRRPGTRMLERTALHVLYVVHGFPPETWAGTEIYTANLAREMGALGHRCTILARSPADRSEAEGGPADFEIREDEFEGLRVLRMTHRLEHGSLRETYDQPRAVAAFRDVLLRENPDLVHFQHLIHTSAGLVQQAADYNLPTILHLHDYWALCPRVQLIRPDGGLCPRNRGAGCFACIHERGLSQIPRLERLERERPEVIAELRDGRRPRWRGLDDLLDRREFVERAYATADLRVSPSRFLRQTLIGGAGFDPHTLIFSDNGMRTDHVRALEKQPDRQGRLRFGFVGSLVWYKGDEVLVRAMNRLAGSRAVLNVFGDFRPEEDEHHASLRELAVADNVHFKGRFNNARLSEVYAEIDVLVVPSTWYENSPITIHEAFLTRTPIVCSDIGGMAEYVEDGVCGLHFRVGDDADLAAVLRRLLEEEGLLEELSRAFPAVKTIAENARETEFRYRQLAALQRPRRARILLEARGIDAVAREGPVEQQGAEMLLLRPGGAVEYDLELAGGGPRRIEIGVWSLASEPTLELGGRVLVDGVEIGGIELACGGREDRLRSHAFSAELRSPRRLRVETASGSRQLHLRIQSVSVRESAPTGKPQRETSEHG